jgi:uncharacterized membrane protein YfcA
MTLPFALDGVEVAFLGLALFVAAFVRGYSGFGFAALVVSAASLVTNPLHLVPVVLVLDVAMTVQQAPSLRGHIDWRRAGGLFAGALVGVPIGLWALTGIGVDAARAVIAAYVLAMCALLLAGWAFRGRVGTGGDVGVGVISGMANAAAVGGLPVAVFFAAQPVAASVFRATLIVYFTLLDLWTLPLMAYRGMITKDTLVASVLALPILILGISLGGRHFLKAAPQEFRRFAIGLLAVLATLGLLKSVV